MPETVFYLAYGSNLHPQRLSERVASARLLQVVTLSGYLLRFHKRGQDGSGKCNAFHTGDDGHKLFAALYAIHAGDIAVLDTHEGAGYAVETFTLNIDGTEREVFTYLATPEYIDESLKPFSWYQKLVVQGAIFHGFAQAYIDSLKNIAALPDPDRERHTRHTALLVRLREA